MRIHPLYSPAPGGYQEFCATRNDRSGCGMVSSTRPSRTGDRRQCPAANRWDWPDKWPPCARGCPHSGMRPGAADAVPRPRCRCEFRTTLAMRNGDGQHRTGHTRAMHGRRRQYLHQAEPALELLAAIADESRPVLGAGHQRLQRRHHLAAIADAQREGVAAREEAGELIARARHGTGWTWPSPRPRPARRHRKIRRRPPDRGTP